MKVGGIHAIMSAYRPFGNWSRKWIQRLLCLSLIWAGGGELGATSTPAWRAGAAAISIDPELPMWMSGYASRRTPANEIVAGLHAKALAVADAQDRRVVMVTVDILGIPRILREAVARRALQAYGLPSEALLINASHTHCGPEIRPIRTVLSEVDTARAQKVAEYQAALEDRLVTVIGQALERLEPAELAYCRGKTGFAMNRRRDYSLPANDPRRSKVPNPNGPVDHEVPVLHVRSLTGQSRAILFGYACHNTTSGDFAFHGDYAGFAQAALEESYPGTVALFMAGCGGDQNPYPRRTKQPTRTAIDLAKHHGRTLALAVEAVLDTDPPPLAAGALRVALETVDLPYLKVPTKEELAQRLASSSRTVSEYARVLLDILEKQGSLPKSYPYPVQLIQFSQDLTLVALASEAVVDYSLRIKRELPAKAVWVAAYSNDFMGYIPSRRVWEEGGYEGGESLTYYAGTLYRTVHSGTWDPRVEDLIMSKVRELYRKTSR